MSSSPPCRDQTHNLKIMIPVLYQCASNAIVAFLLFKGLRFWLEGGFQEMVLIQPLKSLVWPPSLTKGFMWNKSPHQWKTSMLLEYPWNNQLCVVSHMNFISNFFVMNKLNMLPYLLQVENLTPLAMSATVWASMVVGVKQDQWMRFGVFLQLFHRRLMGWLQLAGNLIQRLGTHQLKTWRAKLGKSCQEIYLRFQGTVLPP